MGKVIITDEKGKFVKEEEFEISVKTGLIRKIVRIFIFNKNNELFIQHRSNQVRIYPGRWDASASGHVDPGEKSIDAAYRELKEEIGIENTELNEVARFHNFEGKHEDLILNCFEIIFSGVYNGELSLEKQEVKDGEWISLQQLKQEIKDNPDSFSTGFVKSLQLYCKIKNL